MDRSEFESQPLYCNKFYADDEAKAAYLKAPAWVQKWMDELDKIYSEALPKAA